MKVNYKDEAIAIEFPLRGEWNALTSPKNRIPSHGTNRMGLRYAFDFVRLDKRRRQYKASFLRFLLFGVPLKKFYCWNEKIYAPCDGEIVAVVDGIKERKNVHWLRESLLAIKRSFIFNEYKDDYSLIAGNYIIMRCSNDVYMAFVHLKTNSIEAATNDKIKKGAHLGNIGHSGNSTSPHLHFQLMDHLDVKNSFGIPCCFEKYEVYRNGVWEKTFEEIPSSKEIIRFVKE